MELYCGWSILPGRSKGCHYFLGFTGWSGIWRLSTEKAGEEVCGGVQSMRLFVVLVNAHCSGISVSVSPKLICQSPNEMGFGSEPLGGA